MTDERSLRDYLRARRASIDTALEAALPTPPACPAIIAEAMRYSLFAGGKRLRPVLTIAAAEAVAEVVASRDPSTTTQDAIARAMPAACAIEMIHTYSLVHDDLPAMDDDDLRRGHPTAHVTFGEGIAILAGDGLLTEAFRVLAAPSSGGHAPADHRLRALLVVAAAAGAEGMVGGQAIDLQASGQLPPRTRPRTEAPCSHPDAEGLDAQALRAMHARKTGAIIRAAAVSGAILAGASDSLIEAVDGYASELGLAFQIVDDILDVEGSAEEIGKTASKDAAAGKPTYPGLYGVEESRRLAERCIARAGEHLHEAGLSGWLPTLAEWVTSRNN